MENNTERQSLEEEKIRLWDLASGYFEFGMIKDAVAYAEELVSLDENDSWPYVALGYFLERNKEMDRAMRCYSETIKRFPECYAAYGNLGFCFETYKKRLDIALVLYEKTLEIKPMDAWALNNIGFILGKYGKWRDSLAYHKKAYEISQTGFGASDDELYNLAFAHYKCKNYQEALEVYNALANSYTDDYKEMPLVLAKLSCVHFKMKRFNDAVELLDKALSLCPKDRRCRRLYKIVSKKLDVL
ncbi:MAG TPA: hypothetical protein DCL35_07330 [Candidatus Omnitrophica bacterium]|nr:hypothetical protein [Candidatus Omnitrophota bacterium]